MLVVFIILSIGALMAIGDYAVIPKSQIVNMEADICAVFGIDSGSGNYLIIYTISCKELSELKKSMDDQEIVYDIQYERTKYIDSYSDFNCPIVYLRNKDKNIKEIFITQNQICAHFINFSEWSYKERVLSVDPTGKFVILKQVN